MGKKGVERRRTRNFALGLALLLELRLDVDGVLLVRPGCVKLDVRPCVGVSVDLFLETNKRRHAERRELRRTCS